MMYHRLLDINIFCMVFSICSFVRVYKSTYIYILLSRILWYIYICICVYIYIYIYYNIHIRIFLQSMRCTIRWIRKIIPLVFFNSRTRFCHVQSVVQKAILCLIYFSHSLLEYFYEKVRYPTSCQIITVSL